MATQRRGIEKQCFVVLSLASFLLHFTLSLFCVGELVRRGGRATGDPTEQHEASGWGSPASSDKDLDRPDQDEGYDDKGEDSKAMRLTLMEEVLLLGIKDREVSLLSPPCEVRVGSDDF